ncbi:GtrA-like protein [Thiorhodovibrio winogradskyi]|uniref:GtrA-like protein n=1 Tax=Thiorhodovibrio winogradskyi TaxID=77007 RepID=A0ABZ0S9I1_9GAMM|nr:GtrA family protein [Thiorhodovibrio winogradskyi]
MHGQFLRYVLSGSTALGVHLAVLAVLVEFFALNETLASGVGFLFAILVNYSIQHQWVFQASGQHGRHFPRYLLITFMTFALNLLLFWLAVNVLNFWYPIAQILTTGIIFMLNFFLNRQFTFKR